MFTNPQSAVRALETGVLGVIGSPICHESTPIQGPTRIGDKTWILVEIALREDWSPEQVSRGSGATGVFASVMNGSINMFSTINYLAVICATCAARRSAESAMAPIAVGVN
jgi:hypothetical protein